MKSSNINFFLNIIEDEKVVSNIKKDIKPEIKLSEKQSKLTEKRSDRQLVLTSSSNIKSSIKKSSSLKPNKNISKIVNKDSSKSKEKSTIKTKLSLKDNNTTGLITNNAESTYNLLNIRNNDTIILQLPKLKKDPKLSISNTFISNENKTIETKFDGIINYDNSLNAQNIIMETFLNEIQTFEKQSYIEVTNNNDNNNEINTLSNLIVVQGPKKTGKSTFLRGDPNFNNEIADSNSTLSSFSDTRGKQINQPATAPSYNGLILPLLKETYNKLLTLLKNKQDLLIMKAGCFAIQKDKLININKCKERKYFDELLLFPNENMFYIQHIPHIQDIEQYIEQSLKNREKLINFNDDYVLIFEFLFELKAYNKDKNKSEDKLIIKYDIMEVNYKYVEITNNLPKLEVLIEQFYSKSPNSLLSKLLLRRKKDYDSVYFFLCLKNYEMSNALLKNNSTFYEKLEVEYNIYIKFLDRLKDIFNRKDLILELYNKEGVCVNCPNCQHLKEDMLSKVKKHEGMVDKIKNVAKEVGNIKTKVSKISKMSSIKSDSKNKTITEEKEKELLSNYFNKINNESARLDKMADEIKNIFMTTESNNFLKNNITTINAGNNSNNQKIDINKSEKKPVSLITDNSFRDNKNNIKADGVIAVKSHNRSNSNKNSKGSKNSKKPNSSTSTGKKKENNKSDLSTGDRMLEIFKKNMGKGVLENSDINIGFYKKNCNLCSDLRNKLNIK